MKFAMLFVFGSGLWLAIEKQDFFLIGFFTICVLVIWFTYRYDEEDR